MVFDLRLYGSLAASASVFIGILGALLVNRAINQRSELRQIENRLQRISTELEEVGPEREALRDYLIRTWDDELEDERLREQIRENIEEFIHDYIGKMRYVDIEEFNWDSYVDAYGEYADDDDMGAYVRNRLREYYPEAFWAMAKFSIARADDWRTKLERLVFLIRWRIRRYRKDFSVFQLVRPASSVVDDPRHSPDYNEQLFSERDTEWHQANFRVSALNSEWEDLIDRHESITETSYTWSLLVLGGGIVFSVVVPLFSYLLHVTGDTITGPLVIAENEAYLVFVVWFGGLALILVQVWDELRRMQESDRPDQPELREEEHPLSREERFRRLEEQHGDLGLDVEIERDDGS